MTYFTDKVTHKIFTHNLEPLTQSCQGLYHIPLDSLSVSLLQLMEWKENEILSTHYCCSVRYLTKRLHKTTYASNIHILSRIKTYFNPDILVTTIQICSEVYNTEDTN